jgi:hypothetical protein
MLGVSQIQKTNTNRCTITFGFKYKNLKSCFSQNQHDNKPINTFLKKSREHSVLGELRANNGFLIKSLFWGG